jgi:hypothetical protein
MSLKHKKYPLITSNDFYEKTNELFAKYKIKHKEKVTIKDICEPKRFTLQMPQKFLPHYIHPTTPYTGMLVYHKIGSGKTCTAINIAEKWRYIRRTIFVSSASLLNNFRKELRSKCADEQYISNADREQLEHLHPSDAEYKRIVAESDEKIDEFYDIYSYNKFIDLLQKNKIFFTNKLLIIDEVQNMISESGTYYKTLHDAIMYAPRDLRVVLLSATPIFDHPIEIALTINLLRPPVPFPIGKQFAEKFIRVTKGKDGILKYTVKNMRRFKEMVKGYISYFRGAPPIAFPAENLKYVKCVMSDFQYKCYKTVMSKEGPFKSATDIMTLPNNFFIGSRLLSNIAFPNKSVNKDGYDSFVDDKLELQNLKTYSIKMYKIFKAVKRSEGPVFVYSNFKEYGGIKTFVRILEFHGYKNYLEHGQGKRRFAILSGDQTKDEKEEIRNVFNQKKNVDGSLLKVILGSPATKEGISLLRVKSVHILEPYWNHSRLEQIIGRAVRFCSHKDLPAAQRVVDIFIYLAVHPDDQQTIDRYILEIANKKDRIIEQFEMALKEAAIDCSLNYHANVYKVDEPIKCMT